MYIYNNKFKRDLRIYEKRKYVSKIQFSNQKETCKHSLPLGSLFEARLVLKIFYFQDKLLENQLPLISWDFP